MPIMQEKSFLGIDESQGNNLNADFIIVPVPYEGTVTYQKGTAKAPNAIIEASHYLELYDIETKSETLNIYTHKEIAPEKNPELTIQKIQNTISKFTDKYTDKFVIMLGGEHSISLASFREYKKKYPDLSLLHIDAHTDLRDDYEGEKFSHACVIRRILGEFPDTKIAQIGIRSMSIEESQYIENQKGNQKENHKILYAKDIAELSKEQFNNLLNRIKLTNNIYISLDLDALDPSIMSVGTPEPGGLSYYQILNILKTFIKKAVAADIVELCPKSINNDHSSFISAKIVYKIISYKNNQDKLID